ncbi:MAG: AI-2E family transporter [Bacteroidota bacterium]
MTTPVPNYARASLIFIGICTLIAALYILQGLIVPLIYATILAIVLTPLVNLLVRKRMNRLLAITLTITVAAALILTIFALVLSQISMFSEAIPQLMLKLDALLHQAEVWTSGKFHIHRFSVHSWRTEASSGIINGSKAMVGATLVGVGSLLVVLILIPVYVFMILLYQPLLVEFIHKLFSTGEHTAVNEVLASTRKIIQSYLVGLMVEALIVAILNTACLLILGIDYAIFLGITGALLNIIPYLGGIIAVILPMLMAFATGSPTDAIWVLAGYSFIQMVDNHFIVPGVVASKVKINALISVLAVLAGGALWGLSGMFLSIPLVAILKVVFDHVDCMKPWGFLLGSIEPTASKLAQKLKVKTRQLIPRPEPKRS